jgi:hypothetical protein
LYAQGLEHPETLEEQNEIAGLSVPVCQLEFAWCLLCLSPSTAHQSSSQVAQPTSIVMSSTWIEPPTYTASTDADVSGAAGAEAISILLAPSSQASSFLRGRLGSSSRRQARVEGEVMIKGITSRVLAL